MAIGFDEPLEALLSDLRRQDIRLWQDGDRLRFSAPGNKLPASVLPVLKARKAEILSFLERARLAQIPLAALPAQDAAGAPLSFAQERLWVMERLGITGSAYHLPLNLRIAGNLDAAALGRALTALVARHEPLRTVFQGDEARPVQMVLPPPDLTFIPEPVSGATEAARLAEVGRLALEIIAQPFDLARGPVFRTRLLSVEPRLHVLLMVVHHVAFDGWSTGILIQELTALYEAFAAGREAALAPLPTRYADYAVWQRQLLDGPRLDALLAYWRNLLADAPQLEVPRDRPRPPVQTYRGAVTMRPIDRALAGRISAMANRHRTTPFAVLLAGFAVVLHRVTGLDRVTVGTPSANRERGDVEGLIGFFVNYLVLSTDLSANPTVSEAIGRVRQTVMEAHEYGEIPFEKLAATLQPQRSLSSTPLVQVSFALQDAQAMAPAFTMGDLDLRLLEFGEPTVRFDLELHVWPENGGYRIAAIHNVDLFDATTVETLLDRYLRVLDAMMEAPDTRLADLPVLSAVERASVLDWGRGPPQGPGALVPALWTTSAASHAAATAVRLGDLSWSYAELDAASDRIAAVVQPGTVVGVCLPRTPWLLAALLGVMKAGAAYLPLDPALPLARRQFMQHDAGVTMVLAEAASADAAGPDAVRVDHLPPVRPVAWPAPDGDALAYVIYTSGSTGVPKGVMVSHAGLSHYLRWALGAYTDKTACSAPVAGSIGFDATITGLFLPLLSGGRVDLVADGHELEGLAALLASGAQYGLVKLTPSHLDGLSALLPSEAAGGAHRLVVGGEALSGGSLSFWRAHAPGVAVVNEYGPTETVVGCAVWTAQDEAGSVPIGRPIADTTLYVLDADGALVPPGVTGELFIGGAGVARGYLGQAGLTAARFVPDAFSGDGARLYRTGDLVRWRLDGVLEYQGRRDDQIKLRGHRIELGEIEAALRRHPAVREAAVLLREDVAGQRRLVAYASPAVPADWRAHLSALLPEVMVPHAVVELARMPLTPNGKIDRTALPAPVAIMSTTEAPRHVEEEVLAAIWADLLGLDRVGIHDNFFELGGDSIVAIQVIARANAAGLALRPVDLFESQTIASLAARTSAVTAPVAPEPELSGPVPLTPIQSWFFEQEWADPHHYNQSVLLELPLSVTPSAVRLAVQALLRDHAALRTVFEAGPVQRILPELDPPFTVHDLAHLSVPQRKEAIEAEATALQAGLALHGPLVRVALFTGPAQGDWRGRLLLAMHHLVVDAVSMRIIIDHLDASLAGRVPHRPTTSFASWSHGLTAAAGRLAEDQRGDWSSARWQRASLLPVDHREGPDDVASAEQVSLVIDADMTAALRQEVARAYGLRVNETLLAALAEALRRWTGSSLQLIAVEGHGRDPVLPGADVSGTVGWFTTLFPVLLSLPPFEAGMCLKAVKEQFRRVPGKGLGYGILRHLLHDPALPALPQPQVLFNHLGQFDAVLKVEQGVSLAAEGIGLQQSLRAARPFTLEVSSVIVAGTVRLDLRYSANLHRRATIEALAAEIRNVLAEMVSHCRKPGAGGFTPSDFPLATLDQRQLDAIAAVTDVEDIYPLSPTQQGMLFHTLYSPASAVYFQQIHGVLTGPLQPEALREAWQMVVDRHTALRSSFIWLGLAEPVQVVRRKADIGWRIFDHGGLEPVAEAALTEDLLRNEREAGFDLGHAPLVRITLIRLGPARHRFVWSYHHLVLDGWSTPMVFGEVITAYAALCQGRRPVLPATVPYRRYIAWVREQNLDAARAFWTTRLAGFATATTLELPIPAKPADEALSWRRIEPGVASRLQEMARHHRVTLQVLVQGAWALLLGHHSGTSDVVFGLTLSGRPATLPEAERIAGLFINTVPVRVAIERHMPLGAWLRGLMQQQAAQEEHSYAPLSEIQAWSEVPRGTPLFESILVFENYPVGPMDATGDGLATEGFAVFERTNYGLALTVIPGAAIELRLVADPQRYGQAAVDHLADTLLRVLEGMAACPDGQVADLPVLSAVERTSVLDWGRGPLQGPGALVPALWTTSAASHAAATAVRLGDLSWSYTELDAASDRIAAVVQPGTVVGVCLPRTPWLLAALLGVMKAGAAYLPLDPALPLARRQFMQHDAGVTMVLAEAASADAAGPDAVRVDHLPPVRPVAWPAPDGDTLAYVIYTSGSTGVPKGVMVSHAGLSHYLRWALGAYTDKTPCSAPVAGSIGFDATITGLFLPLLSGGRVDLVADGHELEGLAALLASGAQYGLVKLTPSHLDGLSALLPSDAAGAAHRLVVGGEALSGGSLSFWRAHAPDVAVVNEYGPTETVVGCAIWTAQDEAGSVPIGRPIADTTLYVLDADGALVPPGVTGELFIGGAGVARGYLGQAGLTAARFVPDAFSGDGARLYRTGDLVRWRRDGVLEYQGRRDDQIKLRGHRIELGEIEAALRRHPAVREAAVLLREDVAGQRRLVAYASPAVPADWRAHLSALLPEVMVPHAVVELANMPLTPNGKIDRAALPAPVAIMSATEAPRHAEEEVLAAIWADLLGLDRVGIHDNFFELGGHSLIATQVIVRIQETMQVQLPLHLVFEAPTVALLAAAIATARLTEIGIPLDPIALIPRDGSDLKLGSGQERLFFLDRLEGQSVAYSMPAALRVRGPLDARAFQACLNALAARHETWRTRFPLVDGSPVQRIDSVGVVPVAFIDLGMLPEAERVAAAMTRATEEAATPFDLETGPVVRVALLRLGKDDHVILFTLHHIASDGWSIGVMVQELAVLYSAALGHEIAPLDPLPVQYADYVGWQRKLGARSLDYWRDRLAGLVPLLPLPTDRPRPSMQRMRGASVAFQVDAALTARLRTLSIRCGATLFMTLLSGFGVLLARLSGETDIAIGTPVANRMRPELERLIGFFVNTLVLRLDLAPSRDIEALVAHVRTVALGAYQHQDAPFEQVVEALRPERSMAHTPLFQVMFVLQNAPLHVPSMPLLHAETIDVPTRSAKFDLTLAMIEDMDGLAARLEYDTDLFDHETVEGFAAALLRVLEGMAACPDGQVADLPVLSAVERTSVLDWGRGPLQGPGALVPALWTTSAASHAAATAVRLGDLSWSYAELDAASDRIAAVVQPGTVVGVCLPRTPWLLAALLGVMKAGAAYLPLDPALPLARRQFMQHDAGVTMVLAEAASADAAGPDAVRVDHLPPVRPVAWPAPDGDALAYVIYTSGSTGVPKGVMVSHAALSHYLRWALGAYTDKTACSAPVAGSIGFDATITGLFLPLLSGGRVDLVADGHELEGLAALLGSGAHYGLVKLTPSHLDGLSALLPSDAAGAAHRLVVGGEALSGGSLSFWRAHAPGVAVMNEYGPTETVVGCAVWTAQDEAGSVPIGRPIADTTLYVLDADGGLVPPGVTGELFIGGAGVARGYLGQAGLTAARFVPDAFSGDGARLYRTGDLVRWRRDGVLEYQGRRDDQIKLRGHRIELGEIEAALRRHPAVREAAVLLREDVAGQRRLVAYASPAVPADWRAHLSALLPEVMVPHAAVELARMPLTPNGKIDRAALPAPVDRMGEAARSPLETILCDAFAFVLERESTGPNDDFFALGGHSLLALRLVNRVRALLGVELPLRAIFEAPTPARLAPLLGYAAPAVRPLSPMARPARIPLSFAQQRLWFLDRFEGPAATYHIPIAVRLEGMLDSLALGMALDDVVARHQALRTVICAEEGAPFQVILPPPTGVMQVLAMPGLEMQGDAVSNAVQAPFDLSVDLPLRARLFTQAADSHVLVLVLHHIAGDGGSMAPLVRDLTRAYAARLAGHAPDWDALPVQYADYAIWQRARAGDLEQGVAFWRQALDGIPPAIDLPVSRSRPAVPSGLGATVKLAIDPALHAGLLGLARECGATLFMVLQAGLSTLLSRLGSGNDIVIGTPVSGREDAALDDMVGLFANTLVLRLDTSGNPSFDTLVRRARAWDLDAYAHQDVPFEHLVHALNPERAQGHHPLFQVMLTVQATSGTTIALPGLSASGIAAETGRTRFDLFVSIMERRDEAGAPLGADGSIEFSLDLLSPEDATALAARFIHLLHAVVARPGAAIGSVSLLTDAEDRQLLAWNATETEGPPQQTVVDLFRVQARHAPEKIAVQCGPERLTYAALDALSDGIAMALAAQGTGPVGVMLPRGIWLPAALLGVMKSGAAYVPFDPAVPDAVLARQVAAAGITRFVAVAETASATGSHRVLVLDRTALPPGRPAGPPLNDPTLNDPAYVIFTSGTTGSPKGVQVGHRALANHLCAMQATPGISAGDVLVSVTTPTFDIAALELFLPLVAGARVVIAETGQAADGTALGHLLDAVGATMLQATPSGWAVLLESGWTGRPALRALCGGETIPRWLADRLLTMTAEVWNLYGPTEATIWVAALRVVPETGDVGLGRPIGNLRFHVLDPAGQRTPVGASGRLFISGMGLADGYVGQPGLTAERFVPDPFGPSGTRMYDSGDLVRRRADGTLAFLGRADQQVKLRGYRIEPGEIEAAFLRHPAVARCAVLVVDDRLVAVISPAAAASSGLRAHAAAELPLHMVPAQMIGLDTLPQTQAGKLDRAALMSAARESEEARPDRAPRDTIEQQMAQLWAETLGGGTPGVDDDFFMLGGHSLLAARLAAKVSAAFGCVIPIATLFEAPTVAALSARVKAGGGRNGVPMIGLRDTPGERLYLVHPAGGSSLCYRGLAAALSPEIAVWGFEAPGRLAGEEPFPDIPTMAAAYAAAMRAAGKGPYRIAGWSFGGLVAVEIARNLHMAGEAVALLAVIDTMPATPAALPVQRQSMMEAMATETGLTLPLNWESMADAAQLRWVVGAAAADGMLPEGYGIAEAERQFTMQMAHFAAAEAYAPDPLPTSLLVLAASGEDATRATMLRDAWKVRATAGLHVEAVPGTHGTALEAPEAIARAIARAWDHTPNQ